MALPFTATLTPKCTLTHTHRCAYLLQSRPIVAEWHALVQQLLARGRDARACRNTSFEVANGGGIQRKGHVLTHLAVHHLCLLGARLMAIGRTCEALTLGAIEMQV
jgi:hypothetical protein